MKHIEMIAGWLLVLGGINIGLDGMFGYNLFNSILGMNTPIVRALDVAIGASALYLAYLMLGNLGKTSKKKKK